MTFTITVYANIHIMAAQTDPVTADPLLSMGADTGEGIVLHTSCQCLREGFMPLMVGIGH